MDVYDYLDMVNDLSWVRVSIFDCNSTDTVYTSADDVYDILMDVDEKGFGDYEVETVDIFKNNDGKVCLELNISIEEDD